MGQQCVHVYGIQRLSFSHAYSNSYCGPESDSYVNADTYAHAHCSSESDADTNSDTDRNSFTHADADTNRDTRIRSRSDD